MVKENSTAHGERVRSDILRTGLDLWRNDPASVSARAIGRVLGLTHAGVIYHFDNIANLKQAIAEHAINERDTVVVPQLIAARHPAAFVLNADERAAYLAGC